MQLSQLKSQLEDDTRTAIPPFGAKSIKIARELGTAATAFLCQEVKAQGKTAFLALEALRAADPAAYDQLPAIQRANVYVQMLRDSGFYNAWGVPGYQLTPTAHALITLGEVAVPVLKPLLANQQRAPLSGSEDATTSRMYGNRVCDYAWVLISEILHRPYDYAEDPAARDLAIAALQQDLAGGPGAGGEVF
jgi:hypothetical protein